MQAPFADPLIGLKRLRTFLPVVGRTFELQVMRALLDTVAQDSPLGARALTLSGEMGVGKTRLLAALCLEARERHFTVLEASAYETGRTMPYLPFVEALRPLLLLQYSNLQYPNPYPNNGSQKDAIPPLTPSTDSIPMHPNGLTDSPLGGPLVVALARLFPELPSLLHYEPQALYAHMEPLSPDQEKFRLLDAIATLLERAAEERPIVLAIDNVQWADSASLELMLYLTIRLRTSRVALVGATRPQRLYSGGNDGEEPIISATAASAAARVLGDLVRQGMLLLMPLSTLDQEDAAQHLHALLPGELPHSVEQALLNRAEGNPFFLEELVRTLTLSQQLVIRNGVWQAARISSTKLPDSIVLAVEQRLYGLSDACCDALRTAALFGRTFPIDALAQVVASSVDDLLPLLHEAVEASIIANDPATAWLDEELEDEDDESAPIHFAETPHLSSSRGMPMQRYIFCQGIVQEVLLASVPAHRKRQLHSAIGKALEASYAEDASKHAAELARHYALGGEKEAMLRWSLHAGEDAVRQQAHREAIGHFRLALKLLTTEESTNQAPEEQRPSIAELSLTIGELWSMLGELDLAIQAFQPALQRLQQAEHVSPWLLSRANRLLADAYRMQTHYDQALAHLQAADAALDEEAVVGKATPSRKQMEHIRWYPGSYYGVGSVELQSGTLNTRERIHLLQSQATLQVLLNRPADAETHLWQSYHLAISIGDRSSQAFALHLIGYLRGWGEQIHEAIRLQEQALELYLAIGDPFRATLGEQGLGMIYQGLGEMERARQYSQHGMEHARRYGIRRITGWFRWNEGMMAYAQGDWENSATHLQEALQEATTNNDARLKPVVLLTQAELAFRQGNWREAEQLFLDSIQAATAMEWFPSTIALYGHFLAVTGRRAAARTQLDRAATITEPPGIAGNFYLPFLAEGYIHLNLPERATTYIERIHNLHGFMYYGHAVDRILGVIAIHMGDWATAEQAFEEGLLLCQRAGNQPEEATILYEQARMAVMRNEPVQHVHELCEEARAIFQHYNMERAVTMVNTLRDGARILTGPLTLTDKPTTAATITRQATTSDASLLEQQLTKRELEVLRLVAEGHTDREVADILVISPRTANRHLSNIFVKLDVPGRAAAVAYAVRQGFV
jgi:predicted ATPase/DNA-binding CsgD family transcriptional regulator